jgi:hypothetical protein
MGTAGCLGWGGTLDLACSHGRRRSGRPLTTPCRLASRSPPVQLVSGHPPLLSYSVPERLEPFWAYLESIGAPLCSPAAVRNARQHGPRCPLKASAAGPASGAVRRVCRAWPLGAWPVVAGVRDVGAAVVGRPSLLGLDVDANLRKIVEYLRVRV